MHRVTELSCSVWRKGAGVPPQALYSLCAFSQLSDTKDGMSEAAPALGFGSSQTTTFGSPGKWQDSQLH